MTERAHAVVRVPAITVTCPSCHRRVEDFSSGGSLLERISWKIVLWVRSL